MKPQSNQDQTLPHYTCTSSEFFGTNRNNEYVTITDSQLRDIFGYFPRNPVERLYMQERALRRLGDRRSG